MNFVEPSGFVVIATSGSFFLVVLLRVGPDILGLGLGASTSVFQCVAPPLRAPLCLGDPVETPLYYKVPIYQVETAYKCGICQVQMCPVPAKLSPLFHTTVTLHFI